MEVRKPTENVTPAPKFGKIDMSPGVLRKLGGLRNGRGHREKLFGLKKIGPSPIQLMAREFEYRK
jgi:hypothetical protein